MPHMAMVAASKALARLLFGGLCVQLIALAIGPAAAYGGVELGSYDWVCQGGVRTTSADRITVSVTEMTDSGDVLASILNIAISPTDVGHTFTATAENEAQFAEFASHLTDGVDDQIEFDIQLGPGGGGQCAAESVLFGADRPNGIDFEGSTVTGISLTVNSLTIASPSSDPLGDGVWTDYDLDATVTVIPEPATVALLAMGARVPLWRRRKGG